MSLPKQTASNFEYSLLTTLLGKAQGPWANQANSDNEYSLLCFGEHKGPWRIQTIMPNLIKTRILGFVDDLIRHQSWNGIRKENCIGKHKGTWTGHASSSFEYSRLCFWESTQAFVQVRLSQTSNTHYSAFGNKHVPAKTNCFKLRILTTHYSAREGTRPLGKPS